ncbi:MAG: septum formation initiator [Draconibacterium sp.]|nr:MAG: septum formation initiator [Draconibacterium sp.]
MKIKFQYKGLKKSMLKIWGNKYLVFTILFLAWIIFFDEYSIVSHNKNKKRLKGLIEQKEFYKKQIISDKQKLKDLNSGPENLERFAREQYYMSKPDEEVFIVEEK